MNKKKIVIEFNDKNGIWYVLSNNRSFCTGMIQDVKDEVARRMRKISGSYYNKIHNHRGEK